MDLKQVEYIVTIANENNITKAAEKLFITQSALNQQLLKLERELGTQLFFRSRANWGLTPAGKIYVENALELLRIKRDTYNAIRDIAQVQEGTLFVGFTAGRGISMFTAVYPRFHHLFPGIAVTPMEMGVRRQLAAVARGELDVGFLTMPEANIPNMQHTKICEEPIVLACPNNHPMARYKKRTLSRRALESFAHDPFVLIDRESSLRPIVDGIFESAGMQPNILFETSSNIAIATVVQGGLCCGILPYCYVKDYEDDLRWFFLPSRPVWNIVAVSRNDRYLSSAATQFIGLASDYWQGIYADLPPED